MSERNSHAHPVFRGLLNSISNLHGENGHENANRIERDRDHCKCGAELMGERQRESELCEDCQLDLLLDTMRRGASR